MDDDSNIAARIFVGGVPPTASEESLQAKFALHGPVLQVAIHRGFAFVQFQHEVAAQKAIEVDNLQPFMGSTIQVKPATRRPGGAPSGPMDDPMGSEFEGSGGRGGFRGGRGGRGGGGPPRGGFPPEGGFHGRRRGGPAAHRGGYGGPWPEAAPTPAPPAMRPEAKNDAEIVCVNKMQQRYAESIERRLQSLGMAVDVLFPNPEIPLQKILASIGQRGVTYAILVTPINEEHRSVTLNMLAGVPQEHRNMPLEDAVHLMANDFQRALEAQARTGEAAQGLPEDVRTVVGFLQENRPLSVMEYDKLIKYLAGQREKMLRTEYGDDIPAHLMEPPVGPTLEPAMKAKQGELQAKILDILSRPVERPGPPAGPSSASVLSMGSTAAALDTGINASLQKAIDSLIKTGPNLLSQVAAAQQQQQQQQAEASGSKGGRAHAYYSTGAQGGGDQLFSSYGGY